MLHGCGQERIPAGTRGRGPLVQRPLLLCSPERPEVPRQVVQDRPCEVSVGPPGAYRVGVVAECDPGRLARVSCRVHRGLVRFSGFQPTVDFAAGQLPASPALWDSVSGFARESRRTGEPGRTMNRAICLGDVASTAASRSQALQAGEGAVACIPGFFSRIVLSPTGTRSLRTSSVSYASPWGSRSRSTGRHRRDPARRERLDAVKRWYAQDWAHHRREAALQHHRGPQRLSLRLRPAGRRRDLLPRPGRQASRPARPPARPRRRLQRPPTRPRSPAGCRRSTR